MINTIVLLGPTAVGKTSLGVRLAKEFGWDIISADSRQVYCGLDLGSGKDLNEYDGVQHHLIDITTLKDEYNVFHFQQDFYKIFKDFNSQNKMCFVVGGTGMYVDSVIRGYELLPVPEQKELEDELNSKDLNELGKMLLELKPNLHNMSDLKIKDRVIKALLIELFKKSEEGQKLQEVYKRPEINPLVIGTTLERDQMHKNIKIRLDERINQGMIEEVLNLHEQHGYSWERLERLGLEYRFVSLFLEGKISTKEEMTEQLYHAISQFAKRQETWFRGMERKGVQINWLTKENNKELKFQQALDLINSSINC